MIHCVAWNVEMGMLSVTTTAPRPKPRRNGALQRKTAPAVSCPDAAPARSHRPSDKSHRPSDKLPDLDKLSDTGTLSDQQDIQAQMTRPQDLTEQTRLLISVRDQRDKAAFALLFDYYAPRLRAMLARSGCGGAQADDIVQDTMLKLWHKAGQFDPARASASAWVYRIARNAHVDAFRKQSRPLPDALLYEDPPGPPTDEAVALDQETRRLRAALERLGPAQRAIVQKAYLGELSHSEIRDLTGLPLGTIKSRIRLALERLRHDLKDLRDT